MNSPSALFTDRNDLDEEHPLVERGNCPLCGSASLSVHIGFGPIQVVRCARCGFMFSNRLMRDAILLKYYVEGFGSERHRKGQVVNAVTNAWAVRRLLNGPLTGRKVLDVGTGYGYLLAELQQRFGMTATGVELSAQESKFGKEVLGVDLINCPLSDSGLQPSSFDVVTCFEVIEHVARPREFIEELQRYLKPDGVMIVMTDNFDSDAVETLGSSFPKWIPHSHISHFSATTVCALMQEKGLQIDGQLSFTPWETAARALLAKISVGSRDAETFDLQKVLHTEMGGDYRLFALRRWFNTTWARLTCRDDLQGSLMYVAASLVR